MLHTSQTTHWFYLFPTMLMSKCCRYLVRFVPRTEGNSHIAVFRLFLIMGPEALNASFASNASNFSDIPVFEIKLTYTYWFRGHSSQFTSLFVIPLLTPCCVLCILSMKIWLSVCLYTIIMACINYMYEYITLMTWSSEDRRLTFPMQGPFWERTTK